MTEIKDKILQAADGLFSRVGIRSVSMDDIAHELAMSKKTIYQYVKDKEEIVSLVTTQHLDREKNEFHNSLHTAENALSELYMLSKCMRKHMAEINQSMLFDLQKYHPESWTLWESFKTDFIKNTILRIIKRGKAEGHFRPEIKEEILATFRIETIEITFDPKIFPKDQFDFMEVQMELFHHFVHGLLTIQGQEIYDKMINTNEHA